jgi:hypothetical protein
VRFVVDEVALGQAFSEFFGFNSTVAVHTHIAYYLEDEK